MPFVFPSPLRVLAAIVYAAITFLAGFWLFESFQFYARATSVSLLSMFLLQTVPSAFTPLGVGSRNSS